MRRRRMRWVVFAPVAILAWVAPAAADNDGSLGFVVYDNRTGYGNFYNQSPPLPPTSPIVASGTVPSIDFQWGSGPVMGTNVSEDVVVKFDGWLLPPQPQTYYLCAASDDGFRLILDGQVVIDDWYDRGGGCGQTADVDFGDGQAKALTGWYYENGGGAHAALLYYDGSGWNVVPSSWYSSVQPTPTTTTEPPTTTTEPPTTTTTEPPTTTTEPPTTTTEASTTTTEPPTTTTQASTTTKPSTTTTEPATTTTTTVYVPPATTTSTTTTTEPPTTTTTTTTTVPETTTTLPPTTVPPPPTTVEPSTTTTVRQLPSTTVAPSTSRPEPSTTTSSTTDNPTPSTIPESTTSTTILLSQAVADNPISAVAEAIADTTDPDAINEFFETLADADLTDTEKGQIALLLSAAPDDLKEQFEASINVFEGGYDTYVPSGSTISVGERRVVVAVGALLSAVPVAPVASGASGTTSERRRRA